MFIANNRVQSIHASTLFRSCMIGVILIYGVACESIVGIESLAGPSQRLTESGETSNSASSGSGGISSTGGTGGDASTTSSSSGAGGGMSSGADGGSMSSSSGGGGGSGGGFTCPPVNDCSLDSSPFVLQSPYEIVHNGVGFEHPCTITARFTFVTFKGSGLANCIVRGGVVEGQNATVDTSTIPYDLSQLEGFTMNPAGCSVPFYCKNNINQHGTIFIKP